MAGLYRLSGEPFYGPRPWVSWGHYVCLTLPDVAASTAASGPFFILGALASLGYGLGFLPFGPFGWKWICAVTVIGGIALTCIPELILGRYRRNGPDAV